MSTELVPAAPRHRPGVSIAPARRDAVTRAAAVLVTAASLVVVTVLWITGGGIRDLGGWATGLTSAGRWAGLLSADLLLVQVLLMARLPVVERAFGQDRLGRLHRWTGFVSFSLMLGHVALITWGYADGRLAAVPGTFWDLTVNYPAVLLALAGAACLIMVVVTSVRAARSRMRHESWHLLHLYAYLGVGLVLPHQLWTGQEFLASTAATFFWWTLWAAAAATVLVWRIGLPVARNLRHRLHVTSVVPEGDGVVSVYLTGRSMDRLPVTAGQFLTWRFLTGPGWFRGHPYSLSAAPDGRSLRITVRAAGDGSALVARVRPGTKVFVEGPFGRLTARPRTRERIALIGAGIGITPLRSLAEGLPYEPGDAVLIQRAADRPLFAGELDVLAADRGLQVITSVGPRRGPTSWLGASCVDDPADDLAVLHEWVPDIAARDVYVCGPEGWAAVLVGTLHAAGVPGSHIHSEKFAW